MRKSRLETVLLSLAALCAAAFLLTLGWDALVYSSEGNSAPFWVFALVRALEFFLPAAAFFFAATVLLRRSGGKRR